MTAETERLATLRQALEQTLGLAPADDALGIVSVWADREGRALVWRRDGERVRCERARFRPWLLAAHCDDLAHLGAALADARAHPDAPFTYRELDGPPGGLRFLLSARGGRALDQALRDGAARRLGQPTPSLYELDDYYRVGPVEQYLIVSGHVYFRGLRYDDLHRLQLDLETTALEPAHGRIFMAALRDSRGLELVLSAPDEQDEARLIAELCAIVRERDPDVIENHNLFGFDLPFLTARAAALGVPLLLGRREGPARPVRVAEPPRAEEEERWNSQRYTLAGRELIDTLDAVRRHDFVTRDLPSRRLKDAARHFGVAAPDRVYLPGDQVLATYRRDPELVRRYALDDVAEVDGLSRRLLPPAFALAGMAPRRYERVAYAGTAMGILEPLLIRAYVRAGAAPPRPGAAAAAGPTTPHTGGALHLYATGVAEHVVKADIASLYPSLMVHYAIGPASDRLGVLLAIVRRLLELRLAHKDAARRAEPGSLAAGQHAAMQAAMKLIVNSAYGYLGAGAMALFADRAAADEITARGRAVLAQVVDAMRARGVALIEADTDGVFFAVPTGWGEAEERALVAEVGATLPPGIRLEYEGRYAAMLSHEVKNYALLTYGGQLIVRGVALRSSRSEPYGERFLHEALRCTLQGDVVGLRAAWLAALAALRGRELTAADVATRARLSKTPAQYQRTRARQREAAYEALLGAGRASWPRGERVRFYRNAAGQSVWLPDDEAGRRLAGDDARDYDVEHYVQTLLGSYASRLRKAFAPADFDQLFRTEPQVGLFDAPLEQIEPLRIRPPGQLT